jgi:hypothetical protein
MQKLRQLVSVATPLVWLAVSSACGPSDRGPVLVPIDNQTAHVGEMFTLPLHGSDPEGAALTFSYRAPSIPDLETRAELIAQGPTSAQFNWRPLQTDVGVWAIDFEVSDGFQTTRETVDITVIAAPSETQQPVFRKPTGSGTTLDLRTASCLELDLEVEDNDSASVTFAEEGSKIDGATLSPTGPFTAHWSFCPAPDIGVDRKTLQISATDESKQAAHLVYRIAIQRGCGPAITHTPADASTTDALVIRADLAEDQGIKSATLYYSTTMPAATPDLGAMTAVAMQNGGGKTFAATVPNPAAGSAPGTQVTLYYLVVAVANGAPTASCDQTSQSNLFSMKVEHPVTLGVCASCTADSQCGGGGDNCIHVGGSGEYYCGVACSGDGDCPASYECPAGAVTSVGGASARQCVPRSHDCTMPEPTTCSDDAHEQDDDRGAAANRPPLGIGNASGKSCPAAGSGTDEDWYKLVITDDSQVTLTLTSGNASDLDLRLQTATGSPLATSHNAAGQNETITACLQPGTYYVGVTGGGVPAENSYTLGYTGQNQSCAATCSDDQFEPDDDPGTATVATVQTADKFAQAGTICPDNSDYYWVYLRPGDTLRASLTFSQSSPAEDLDLWIWDSAFENLVGSATTHANEYYEFSPGIEGEYYVEIAGWQHSQNTYGLCLSRKAGQCPVY